jgi:hypothetical protein
MSKTVLSVIDTAYRAAQEEQDDAGLWFSAACQNAGVDLDILLTGNAVNYAVKGHRANPLVLGGGMVTHPFDPEKDIGRMASNGASFYLIREDAEERGIDPDSLIGSIEQISRAELANFVGHYENIWHW